MLIGARTAAWSGGDKFPYPFKEDLICCYDGIWNGGVGVHNTSGLVWKDISGNGIDATYSGQQSKLVFGDNYIQNNCFEEHGLWFDFVIPGSFNPKLNSGLSMIFVNGKTNYWARRFGWPMLSLTKPNGVQNERENVSVFNVDHTYTLGYDRFMSGNATMFRCSGKNLTGIFVDSEKVVNGLSGGDLFNGNNSWQIARNCNFKIYAAMVYGRSLTDEEWYQLLGIINNRFNFQNETI